MPKKHFSIYPRTKEAMLNGLSLDRGTLDFKGKTIINTSDASLAREVQEKYGDKKGGSTFVVHDEQLSRAKDSGTWDIVRTPRGDDVVKTLHNYKFGASSLAYQENYERIFGHK